MNNKQLQETLQQLAHYVTRNEIVCEHFLAQESPASPCDIAETVREVDNQLGENTAWQRRFPSLFPQE